MKREIIFRCYRPSLKSFVSGYVNGLYLNFETSSMKTNENEDDFILQQFTGLTDKNGVKIFEGDIVRHLFEAECIHNEIKEVYFDNELLEFGLKNSSELFNCQFSDEFEVIGNIFDNPKLLF